MNRFVTSMNTSTPIFGPGAPAPDPPTPIFAGSENLPPTAWVVKEINSRKRQLVKTEYLGGSQAKRAKIWEHGLSLLDPQSNEKYWACKHCHEARSLKHQLYLSTSSTNNWWKHLKQEHRIQKEGSESSTSILSPGAQIDSYLIEPIEEPTKPTIAKGKLEQLKDLFIRWIVTMHISFYVVECQPFRALLRWFSNSTGLTTWLPQSHSTITDWVLSAFLRQKQELCQILGHARSNIHISFDLWTSSNNIALLGIVAHFIDEEQNRPASTPPSLRSPLRQKPCSNSPPSAQRIWYYSETRIFCPR